MKQWLLNWLLKDIMRFEVINHHNVRYEIGRIITQSNYTNNTCFFEVSLQDKNKTLKIFI